MTRETLRDELQMAHDLLDLIADPMQRTHSPNHLDYLFGVFNKAQSLYKSGQFDMASEFLNSFWRAVK